ncbi:MULTISPECIES: DUF7096 domain-containing protein [Halolamina]|uniref:Uncharacterized protein n=1 Tax=Halolamina pelagica TaxID=699431 RepID=A0A1I5PQD1_9EURY|nr:MULTISPECIES: hypothetical protein [Halolamina]NHX34916.1 hypothetical protein [Halolamina sp. R1-12]SFP36338.1 hypothetical protein SAMN05216277_10371 [Halolamina pelagica]
MRSLAIIAALALSLALAVPAGIGAAGAPPAAPTDSLQTRDTVATTTPAQVEGEFNRSNQTRVLVVPDGAVQRSEVDGATLNLGPAAEFNGNVTAVEVETAAVVEYIRAAEDESERSRRIIQASSTVETEIITLRDRQEEAIRAFNAGELTAEEFVIELATVSAKADALEARMVRLTELADGIDGFSLSRPTEIRYELRTFGGPVRERAVDAVRGVDDPTQFFVTTGPEGYELATVDDGYYHREAFRGAVKSGDNGATMEPSEAVNVTRESYPDIFRYGDPSATTSGTTNIVTVSGGGRSLTAFVDSGSERVFKEYQRFSLEQYRSDSVASNTINGINVSVNRTYPGGPLRITVTDAESGEPIDLAVTLSQGQAERTEIGRTGDDGTIWAVSPRGSYTVLAVGDETTAAYVETNATEPPEIEG